MPRTWLRHRRNPSYAPNMITRFLHPAPPPLSSLFRPFFTTATTTSTSILTSDDLTEMNTLIHSLADSDHFQEAIRLLSAALLASPPFPSSLPSLPLLIRRLAAQPSLSPSMFLLTTLRHHNPPPSPALPFCSALLISSYLDSRRLAEASKVFSWMVREDSPCRPDAETYRMVVGGLGRRDGRAVEVVRAVREMVRDGVEVGEEVRGWLWRGLLTEARVDVAKELDAAIAAATAAAGEDKGVGDGIGELIDRILGEWEE